MEKNQTRNKSTSLLSKTMHEKKKHTWHNKIAKHKAEQMLRRFCGTRCAAQKHMHTTVLVHIHTTYSIYTPHTTHTYHHIRHIHTTYTPHTAHTHNYIPEWGGDTHVVEIFEVNGRHAAQHREAEIHWARLPWYKHRLLVAHVWNHCMCISMKKEREKGKLLENRINTHLAIQEGECVCMWV